MEYNNLAYLWQMFFKDTHHYKGHIKCVLVLKNVFYLALNFLPQPHLKGTQNMMWNTIQSWREENWSELANCVMHTCEFV